MHRRYHNLIPSCGGVDRIVKLMDVPSQKRCMSRSLETSMLELLQLENENKQITRHPLFTRLRVLIEWGLKTRSCCFEIGPLIKMVMEKRQVFVNGGTGGRETTSHLPTTVTRFSTHVTLSLTWPKTEVRKGAWAKVDVGECGHLTQ